jgi:uncharacterized protein YcgL (UPF0745 family)
MPACRIYRSEKKTDTYLYLEESLEFKDIPDELQKSFGEPHFVMRLELDSGLKLAYADTANVLAALKEHGFYLQLPPKLPVEEEITRRFS